MKDFQFLIKRIQKQGKKIYLAPIILVIFLIALIFVQNSLDKRIENVRIKSVSDSLLTWETPYPVIDLIKGKPVISAKSAVVMDSDSQVVLFSKNENLVSPMASTTKLVTALVALDYFGQDDIITVNKSSINGVTIGFRNGERVYFKDMLYAMLLPSANDAALAVAQNYQGGDMAFVLAMNNKAEKYHLLSTRFSDPSGLDEENSTTALDLTRLATIVMKDKILAQVVGTQEREISDITGTKTYKLINLNKLLGKDGINGVKTGFTTEAGEVLITSRQENGHNFIIVVMNSEDRFLDTEKLVDYIKGNISYLNLGL
ncbi:MAG: hypothetical protein Q7S38_01600 [bacterium]|nr:hypothetical protein [bacterium]